MLESLKMINQCELPRRLKKCCIVAARIEEMRLDQEYEATVMRAGNDALTKWNFRFICESCGRKFRAYVVCNRSDWPPLGEYVDTGKAVPADAFKAIFKL